MPHLGSAGLSDPMGGNVKFTRDGGLAVLLKNGTGAPSVRGTVVSASTTEDMTVIAQANTYDAIGAMLDSGAAPGAYCWVVVSGIAYVLYKDSTAATGGNIAISDDVDGRASDISNPGGGLPGADTHFQEIGHVLESKSAGTGVLVRVNLHFN